MLKAHGGAGGNAGGSPGTTGATGSIIINTAQSAGSVDTTNLEDDPTVQIFGDQNPVCAQDPLPDGTISYTQGFYGASQTGVPQVIVLIDPATETFVGTCDEIVDTLNNVGVTDADILGEAGPVDCTDANDRIDVADFLTGGSKSASDGGFLPSGGGGIGNLAAQKITLLLNLNVGDEWEWERKPGNWVHFLKVE